MIEKLTFEELNITPSNPLLSRCMIKVCYVSDKPNRNGSIITKDSMREIANTLPGCPIVGFYNEQKEDFEGHNEIIEIDKHSGKIKFKVLTFPYGFVPPDAKVWFQDYNENGEIRTYLCTEGILWTGQFPESQKIIESPEGKGQSMEFSEEGFEALYNIKSGAMIINDAIFSKLCALGDDIEPCFEGARIIPSDTMPNKFSLDGDLKNKIDIMMKALTSYQLMEDNNKDMELEKELSEYKAKFELLEKQHQELQTKLDEATAKISEYTALNLEQKYADLEKVFEEKKAEFSKLEEEVKVKNSELEEEVKTLREFKAASDLKDKENMINSFTMLSDEDKKEVKDNIQNYSLEEIESKLAVTCFRKKVDYKITEEEKEVTPNPTLTYSLNNGSGQQGSPEAPEWIKLVQQKEQELFI